MKRIVFILMAISLLIGCNKESEQKEIANDYAHQKQTLQPQEKWQVVKEKDELGNTVRYDSTYVRALYHVGGKKVALDLDSLQQAMMKRFESPFLMNNSNNFILNTSQVDSIFSSDLSTGFYSPPFKTDSSYARTKFQINSGI